MGEPSKRHVALIVLIAIVKIVWVSAMIITPLLGMWLSSSLAAYNNSSMWVSLGVGLLLFPVAPLGWEWLAQWRRRRKEIDKPHILTRLDRLVLRTLCLNLAFITVTVWSTPATAFRALATRGDWMLEGRDDGFSNTVRSGLFAIAETLEGFYNRTEDNHFGDSDSGPDGEPAPVSDDVDTRISEPADPGDDKKPSVEIGDTHYPWAAKPHEIVASIPESAKGSYKQVARYIGDRIVDPFERVKALHDFVVDRLTYDDATFEAYQRGDHENWPSQQAADVFAARTAVCEGYSRLLVAMGSELDIEIAYVVGRGGRDGWEVDGVDHAWNAVKLEGKWYLIDATWNDGQDNYDTAYLFTPPSLFRLDHLPEDERWQLHPEPMSVSDFMRQPMISPQFVLYGLEMIKPDRAQVTVGKRVEIALSNPRGTHVLGVLRRKGADDVDCAVTPGAETRIVCELPGPGRYTVDMYGRRGSKAGSYPHVAKLFVNSK